ncbi:MAG: hypothetical protein ACO393_06145, partial [Methylophilaceae bacterium]
MSGIAAAIGAGVAVLGTGFQISQALQQTKMAKDAQRASAEALAQAKQRLDVNRFEGIQVPLESYERMMEEMTAQQKQSITSLQEADERSLAAGMGRLYAAASGETEKAREQMGKAIYDRDKMIADQEAMRDRALSSISLEEAIGFEKEAAQREQMAAMNVAGAVAGLGQAASLYQQSRPLYSARQGELGAAQAYQQQTGMYQGMSAGQARRAMLDAGITPQGFQNLAAGLTVGGRAVQTPMATPMAGYSFGTTGIQPIQLP